MHRKQDIRQLIHDCQNGERNAQKQLFMLFVDTMLNTCFRMLNNREDAEDVVQDGFIQAYARLDDFRHDGHFQNWLKKIMINKCLDRLKQRKLKIVDLEETESLDLEEGNGYNEIEEPAYTIADVQRAMQNLPDGLRVVFSLYYIEGYDLEEISSILGIGVSGSKSQLSKARRKIRENILLNLNKNVDHLKSK